MSNRLSATFCAGLLAALVVAHAQLPFRPAPWPPVASNGLVPGIIPGGAAGTPQSPSPQLSLSQKPTAKSNFANSPLYFETNQGQADPQVRFSAQGPGYSLHLMSDEAVLQLHRMYATPKAPSSPSSAWDRLRAPDLDPNGDHEARNTTSVHRQIAYKTATLRMKLAGANPGAKISGDKALPGKVNYLHGRDPRKWQSNVGTVAQVRYKEVYSGIDLVYYGNQKQLEYDFIVKPHADPSRIGFAVKGAKQVTLNKQGELVLKTTVGDVKWHKPVIYQETRGKRRLVAGHYALQGKNRVGFALANYDHSQPLVIDPSLAYSTYLGGNDGEDILGVASDGAGNAYVTGRMYSANLPVTSGAFQTTHGADGGNSDAYVAKYNSQGFLVYCTYLGGNAYDGGYAIAADSAGNAYITGDAQSANFPTTSGTLYPNKPSPYSNAYIAKFSPTGSLIACTFFGGANSSTWAEGLAVDSGGNPYITGYTNAYDLPVSAGAYQATHSNYNYWNAYVAKLNNTLSSVAYCTYLHGDRESHGRSIAVDVNGNAVVLGNTYSRNYPVTGGALQSTHKGFVLHKSLNAAGSWFVSESGLTTPAAGSGQTMSEVYSMAVSSGNSNLIYANGDAGVYRSTDGGANWSFVNIYPFCNVLVADPIAANTAYILYFNGMFKSTNAGLNWTLISPVSNVGRDCKDLAISRQNNNILYLATIQGVYKSTDGANSWFPINNGLPSDNNGIYNAYSIAVDPFNSNIVYLATPSGAYKTVNGGGSWFTINTGMPLNGNTIYPITIVKVDPTNSNIVYARTDLYNGHIMRSVNGGASWSDTNTSGVWNNVQGILIDPVTPTTIYHVSDGSIWKSLDSGVTWNNSLNKTAARCLVLDPQNHNTLYTGSWISWDGFVTKLNSTGTGLIYSTLMGGEFHDFMEHIAVDPSGNAVVTGSSNSYDFPLSNAKQGFLNGYQNAIVARLSPTGTPIYSTYLGGNNYEIGNACATDAAGNAYITGQTYSNNFYVVNALQPTYQGSSDIFITKLSANGQNILYSSYMGTAGYDWPRGIATDGTNIFVGGHTDSNAFPLSYFPQQSVFSGNGDNIITNTVPNNSPPNLVGDTYTVYANTKLDVFAPGILANDSDPDGDAIVPRIYYVVDAAKGRLILFTNGALVFTPAPNFRGTATSGYFASAGSNAMSYAPLTFNVVNPVPTITSLSPSPAYVGDPGFTLTVTGTGYVPESVVKWNGSARTTTYVSTTQLKINVTAADVAAAGSAAITVFNPAPSGGTSAQVNLPIAVRAPVISNVAVSSITDTSALVTWTTDVAGDSKANYGLTSAYDHSVYSAAQTTSHSLTLTSLTPGKTYHFQVATSTPYGGAAASGDGTFTTIIVTNPNLAFKVSNTVANANRTSVTVTYTVTNSGGQANNFSIDSLGTNDPAVTPGGVSGVPSTIAANGAATFTVTWNRPSVFAVGSSFFGNFTAHYRNTAGSPYDVPASLRVRVN